MRRLLLLLPILLTACASQDPASTPASLHEPTVQMTMVATALREWPYRGTVTFAIPDDQIQGQEQSKAWLPLFQSEARSQLVGLGLQEAPVDQADVIVSLGVLGEKESADQQQFSRLGLDPGVTTSRKGTIVMLLKDRQSKSRLWSAALQASSDMPITEKADLKRTAHSLISQMTMRLPRAN